MVMICLAELLEVRVVGGTGDLGSRERREGSSVNFLSLFEPIRLGKVTNACSFFYVCILVLKVKVHHLL